MAKIKAFLVHFLLSGVVISCFVTLIWFIWYPDPFLKAEGGLLIIALLVGVDLMLGPTLTAIVYKKGKKGLLIDLSFIVLLQLSALLYGMHVLYQERPQYVAFVVDRFELVPAASINTDELTDKTLRIGVFDKPRFIFIELEEDPALRSKILMETIYGGKGYSERPAYYRDIEPYLDTLRFSERQLVPDSIIERYPELGQEIGKLATQHNTPPDQLLFYPLKGKRRSLILVLKKSDLSVVGGLEYVF